MPFYRGGTLAEWMEAARPPDEQKQRVLTQVLRGIEYMHANGVVHLDIKPANVFMSSRDAEATPRVGDFDVSRSVEQRAACLTQEFMGSVTMGGGGTTNVVRGTLGYIAPDLSADGACKGRH